MEAKVLLRRIRICMYIIIAGLAISGISAIPLETELRWLVGVTAANTTLHYWLQTVYNALSHVNSSYPFLSYGTDWLAFAHIVLAILFTGPAVNPVKNIWVIQFGLIACVLILPLAFIAGPLRGVPFFWQLIDCSFGVLASVPLYIALRYTKQLSLKPDYVNV